MEESSGVAFSEEERNAIREDLMVYLKESLNRVGADGKRLVTQPKIFNEISEAMSREDLHSSGNNKPWSKYLFEQSASDALNQEHSGRYQFLDEEDPDKQLKIGLAGIQMLDSQLLSLTQKEISLRRQLSEPTESPRSDFFMTRVKSQKARSDKSLSPRFGGEKVASVSEHDEDNEMAEEVTSENSSDREASIEDEAETIPSKNFLEENIRKVSSRKKLTEAEQQRLDALLDDSFEAEKYGRLPGLEAELQTIDSKLKAFGRSLEEEAGPADPSETCRSAVEDRNFLSQQRFLRSKKKHEQEVENRLLQMKSEFVDLTGLLEDGETSNREEDIWNVCRIPSVDTVMTNASRRVTLQDVRKAVEILRNDDSVDKTDIDRAKLDKILSFYRPEIDRLDDLRQARCLTSNNSSRGSFPFNEELAQLYDDFLDARQGESTLHFAKQQKMKSLEACFEGDFETRNAEDVDVDDQNPFFDADGLPEPAMEKHCVFPPLRPVDAAKLRQLNVRRKQQQQSQTKREKGRETGKSTPSCLLRLPELVVGDKLTTPFQRSEQVQQVTKILVQKVAEEEEAISEGNLRGTTQRISDLQGLLDDLLNRSERDLLQTEIQFGDAEDDSYAVDFTPLKSVVV